MEDVGRDDAAENVGPVLHAVFRRAVEVPVARLPRINAPIDLRNVLEEALMGPARGQSMVVSVLRVEEETVTQVTNMIVMNVARIKRICVPAAFVHPEAPSEYRMTLVQDYSMFVFPPNQNQSDLIQASRLRVKFYSSFGPAPATRVEATAEEVTRYGLTDFQVRLCLTPGEDPRMVEPVLVAIPVTTVGLDGLLSPQLAKHGRGFPVLLLSKEPAMAVGPRPARDSQDEPFGAPAYPVVWKPLGGGDPQPADVLTSVLAMWGNATVPRLVDAELWTNASSSNPVVAHEIPAEHRWPVAPRNDAANPEGKFSCVKLG